MAYETAGKNLMLDALATAATYVGILDSGGTEVTGGDPAYARQAATFAAASGGSVALSNDPEFNIPASTTIKYAALFSASSGGTKYATATLSSQEAFTAQGTYTLTAATFDLNS
jgi:hypothetical protein